MKTVAVRQPCVMCGGYGCLVIWTYLAPRTGYGRNAWSTFTWSTQACLTGQTARCPMCWDAETERIAWLRASRRKVAA